MALRAFSLFYFFIFAVHAVAATFMSLHWKREGYDSLLLALTMAAVNLGGMIGAPLLLRLIKRTVPSAILLRVTPLLVAVSFLTLSRVSGYAVPLTFWFALCILHSGSLAVIDYLATRQSNVLHFRYEHVRVWGSIGFIVGGQVTGASVDLYGVSTISLVGALFAIVTALCAVGLGAHIPGLDEREVNEASSPEPVRWTSLLPLLAIVLPMWCSHAPLYALLSVYLRDLGWSGTMISATWNVGVVSEIIAFLLFYRLNKIFDLPTLLLLSTIATTCRWLVMATCTDPVVVISVQVLHGFSYGCTHVCSLKLLQRLLLPAQRSAGQAALISLAVCPGLLLGTLGSGLAAERYAPLLHAMPLLMYGSAILAGVATLIALWAKCTIWRSLSGTTSDLSSSAV